MKPLATLLLVIFFLNASNVLADLSTKPRSLDLYGHQVDGTTTADGRLIAFVVEPDKEIAYRRETAPGSGEWGARKGLGVYGNWIKAAKHADGRISLFIIGTLGNVLSRVTQSAPDSDDWGKEREFSSAYGKEIHPVSYPDGRLALFYLDMGREISLIEETAPDSGEFGSLKNLGLYGNRFEVGTHGDGSLDIAIIGTMANVLSHARLGSDGAWREKDIKRAYATDLAFQNGADGALHLFYVDPQREIARVDMSQPELRQHDMDLYGNDIVAVADADGSIEIIIIGTMGNALGRARQVSPDTLAWGKEQSMKGYAKWLSPVAGPAGPTLFSVAPFASEVHVYR